VDGDARLRRPEQVLLVTNKFGKALPPIASRCPQATTLQGRSRGGARPGRYFLNPVEYDWEVRDRSQIPPAIRTVGVGRGRHLKDPRRAA
jgi:hypothetical protein